MILRVQLQEQLSPFDEGVRDLVRDAKGLSDRA
jgi:hypothetical protein